MMSCRFHRRSGTGCTVAARPGIGPPSSRTSPTHCDWLRARQPNEKRIARFHYSTRPVGPFADRQDFEIEGASAGDRADPESAPGARARGRK